MTIEQWMDDYPDLVYDEFGDMPIYCLARRMKDDAELGKYVREKLEARHKYETEARNIPREPDTEQTAEIRALNEENRRAHG